MVTSIGDGEKLYPVAERVAKFKSVVSRYRNAIEDLTAG